MAYWQLPSAMCLRDFDFQSQAILMGGSPLTHSALAFLPVWKIEYRNKKINKKYQNM